jgi:hypothetical protein
MPGNVDALVADRQFFSLLLANDVSKLSDLLVDDFTLIDVMSGSEVDKATLLGVLSSGQLKFHSIDPAETRSRTYGPTSVVTGRTRMVGIYGDAWFEAASRYTHVYVQQNGVWRMVAAQGTKIAAAS